MNLHDNTVPIYLKLAGFMAVVQHKAGSEEHVIAELVPLSLHPKARHLNTEPSEARSGQQDVGWHCEFILSMSPVAIPWTEKGRQNNIELISRGI